MSRPMTEAAKNRGGAALVCAGRRLFPFRLALGLLGVAAGALVIRPGNLFGVHKAAGIGFSLGLVAAGLALRAWAAANAGGHTRSDSIEAPRLSTGGPYAYVRNPIYLGTILLGLGMVGLLRDPKLLPLHLGVVAVLYLSIIPAEEAFLRSTFRAEYEAFCANVPRLVPRLSPWPEAADRPADWREARGDLRIGLLLAVIYGVMRLAVRLKDGRGGLRNGYSGVGE